MVETVGQANPADKHSLLRKKTMFELPKIQQDRL